MLQLLRIEWYKIRFYKAVWIMIGLFILCLIGWDYLWYVLLGQGKLTASSNGGKATPLPGHSYEFPAIWESVSFWSGWLFLFPALIIITLVCNEYTFRTQRQNVIDGWTRLQFVVAKMLWVVILSLVTTLLVVLVAIWLGAKSGSAFSMDGFSAIGYFFFETLTYLTFALFLGFWLKRVGLALVIFLVYVIAKVVTHSILVRETKTDLGYYLPLQSVDALVPVSRVKDLSTMFMPHAPSDTILFVVSLGYLVIFGWLSTLIFTKSDL